jgi:hypothetical protein
MGSFCLRSLSAFLAVFGGLKLLQATPQHLGDSSQGVHPLSTDAFFRAFEDSTLEQARADCMGGEKVQQNYGAKSHTRSVSKMSNGYFYGMMMSYLKNMCRVSEKKSDSSAPTLESILSVTPDTKYALDTLRHYKSGRTFPALQKTQDYLIQNYALMLPLGMLESSGMFNEGRDKSASNVSSETTEAGLFQVSYNSRNLGKGVLNNVYKELMAEYQNGDSPMCMRDIYSINQRASKNSASYGSGEGRRFQDAMKKCPAMATDYMAALLRVNHKHNGPLNRKEARPRESCIQVMEGLKEKFQHSCKGLEATIAGFPSDPNAQKHFAINDNPELVESGGNINPLVSPGAYRGALEDEQSYGDQRVADLEKQLSSPDITADEADSIREELAKQKARNAEIGEALKSDPELLRQSKDQAERLDKEIAAELRNNQTELARANTQKSELQAKVKDLEERVKTDPSLKEELEKAKVELEATEEKLIELQENRAALEVLKKENESELKKIEEAKKAALERIGGEMKLLQEEISKLEEELKALKEDPDQTDTVAQKEKELVDKKKKLSELKAELDKFNKI